MGRAIQVSGRKLGRVGVVAAILLMAGPGLFVANAADELPKESVLPVSLAGKAAQAALDFCKKDGYRVSA